MDNRDMIAEAMEYVGITQSELAERMGITQPTLSALIKYDKISVETMQRIADALGAEYVASFEFREGKKISSDDIVPKEIIKTNSDKINVAMKKTGLSQNKLSQKLGLSGARISQKLKEDKFVTEDMQKIADILGVSYANGSFIFPDGTII